MGPRRPLDTVARVVLFVAAAPTRAMVAGTCGRPGPGALGGRDLSCRSVRLPW